MLLEFIIALGLLILLHEAGHFFAGLLFKFKIEEFGIGYPPRLFKLFTKNGVDYTVNMIPFGGFTRFKGENDPDEKDGFYEQNKWKRLGVMVAGPAMNVLIGIILFTTVYLNTGKAVADQVLIHEVQTNTPAATAGLQSGDHILQIDDIVIDSMNILSTTVSENLGEELSMLVERNGEELSFSITPREEYPDGQGPLGIVMANPVEPIGFLESVSSATRMTKYLGEQLISIPSQLIKGEVSIEEVRPVSPKGIYDIYSQVRTEEASSEIDKKAEMLDIFWFFGIISVSLGYSNLIPIPALDGGRILFLIPELITGKRLPQKLEGMVNLIGFTILMVLMIFVFIQDFTNPIVLP